jgi:digeranylgeranylglycerophospholipid reductase
MKAEFDVTIIGAGPAGLSAAITAARGGLRVALIERKTRISSVSRSCCSSLITEPDTHGEQVTLLNGNICFKTADFSVPYNGPSVPLVQAIRFSPGGNKLVFTQGGAPLAVSINKERLLEGILREAQQLGVTVLENTLAEKAENTGDMVTVFVRQYNRSFEIHSKTAIAADGVNSRIVDQLGLNKDRKFFAQFHVITYYMEHVSCPYPPAWMVFVGKGHTPSGMGQLYMLPKPRENGTTVYEVTYGCPITDKSAIKNDLDWFISQGRFSQWFQQARCIKTLSAVLRFHTPLAEPVAGRVLVAGDAASFIEVYMQGAMMYGYKAAQAIINFIQHGTGFNDYTSFWKKTYGYNQPGAIEAATQAFGLHVLEDAEVDYLFSLTDREEHAGFVNEFSDRENIMKALLLHSNEIKRDQPALAAKLENFSKRSVEELLQVV